MSSDLRQGKAHTETVHALTHPWICFSPPEVRCNERESVTFWRGPKDRRQGKEQGDKLTKVLLEER